SAARRRLAGVLGRERDREQDGGVLGGLQVVALRRDHHVVAGAAAPLRGARVQDDAALEHLQGRLAGALVLAEPTAGRERDEGLAQGVLAPAVHGLGAAARG